MERIVPGGSGPGEICDGIWKNNGRYMTEMRHISTDPPVFTQYSFYIVYPTRHMILYKGPIGPSMGTNQYFISRQSDYESSARSYPRKFPLAIAKAKGAVVEDV